MFLFLSQGCFQPKEGCLDVNAVNYDVTADDPCSDNCCTYPAITVAFQHRVVLPSRPDTAFLFRYDEPYPAPFDTAHYFSFDRSRFFLTDFRLVREDGSEVSVRDSLQLETVQGASFWTKNSFAKVDRDIFQPAQAGRVVANGIFTHIKFTLGLKDPLPTTNPLTVPTGHPLVITGDTVIYNESAGYIPNRLIFRRDSLPDSPALDFRFTSPKEVILSLGSPFFLERGFNIRLTLTVNYLDWFDGVDLINDDAATMKAKIDGNLTKAIYVTEIRME